MTSSIYRVWVDHRHSKRSLSEVRHTLPAALPRVAVLALLLGLPAVPAGAGLFDAVKKAVSAPFKIIGGIAGSGVSAAVDPALDGAFTRAERLTDRAAEKFAAEFGQLTERTTSRIDQIAETRLSQIDVVMETRLDQVDGILDKQFDALEDLAARLLDRQAEIIDVALRDVRGIAAESLSELGQITSSTLAQLQRVEVDAFERLEAVLQDQIPFAAGRVARDLAFVLAFVFPLVALLIAIAVRLGLRIRDQHVEKRPDSVGALYRCWSDSLRKNLRNVPVWSLSIGVPLIAMSTLVYGIYLGYARTANDQRIERLVAAAEVLEAARDFQAAGRYRARVFSLKGTSNNRFRYERDRLLAGFSQSALIGDREQQRLELLTLEARFPQTFARDAALEAVKLYLTVEAGVSGPEMAELQNRIKDYQTRFLNTTEPPALGELALVTELRLTLADPDRSVPQRLERAREVSSRLVQRYPSYAAGLVAHAVLLASERRRSALGPRGGEAASADEDLTEVIARAAAFEPARVRTLRLRLAELPEALARDLRTPPEGASDRQAVEGALADFSAEMHKLARRVFGEPNIAALEAERAIHRAIRRDVGVLELTRQVEDARALLASSASSAEKFTACLDAAEAADEIDLPGLASIWLEQSRDFADAALEAEQSQAHELDRALRSKPLARRMNLMI